MNICIGCSSYSFRRKHLFKSASTSLITAVSILIALCSAQAQARDISRPTSRITIEKSTNPRVRSAVDAGTVDDATMLRRMILVLGPSEEQEHELRSLLDSQQTKGSPNYRHWLTPEEFSTRFGPSQDSIQQATTWLQQQGLSVDKVARGGRWIEFSGATAQVNTAFRTQMRHYQVQGRMHTANATDISFPATLVPAVRGVLSLDDFESKPMLTESYLVRRDASGNFAPVDPIFSAATSNGVQHYLAPGDFSKIYALSPLYQSGIDGTGQTIAIVARSDINLSDVEIFRQAFGLPFNDPNVILNGPDPGFAGTDIIESSLDVAWAGAATPRATIDLVISASTTTTDGVALSAAYVVDNNLAGVMSVSYGLCEANLGPAQNAFYNGLWEQAAAEGISVIVAAGDNGAAGCENPNDPNDVPAQQGLAVNGIASTPFNTAVGGTQFAENGNDNTFWSSINGDGFSSVTGYIPEAVWDESCDPTITSCPNNVFNLFAGSGGVSTLYTKPSWQAGAGVQSDGQRDLPDVSLAAADNHDGFLICAEASCLATPDGNLLEEAGVVGGTSAAAPSFAGIMALVDQKLGANQGLANYSLYSLAAKENNSHCDSSTRTDPTASSQCVFNDVTAGNNNVPGLAGTVAGAGYDLATGLGSINGANLVGAWSSETFVGSATSLSMGSVPAQHGQPAQVTVNVTSANGGGVPSGDFALISDKYGPVGKGTLANGSFAGSFDALPGGQYNLTAHYQGDGTFGSSDSGLIPVNIGTEDSSISLNAYTYGPNGPMPVSSIPFGNFIYFHVKVTSTSGNGFASGQVTFQDGATLLGTITLNSQGEGEFVSGATPLEGAVLCLPVGNHQVAASYSGDNSLNPSLTTQAANVEVTKTLPTVFFFNSAPVNIPSTQQATFVLSVDGIRPFGMPPTGTVQFLDGGSPLGALVGVVQDFSSLTSSASMQISLPVGVHTITANYSGDDSYTASGINFAASPLIINVSPGNGAPTTTNFIVPSTSATVNQDLSYTVTVSSSKTSSIPTGTVQLYEPSFGVWGGPVTLQNGNATLPMQWLFSGSHNLIAQYSGDSNYAASWSTPITVSVTKATPSISVISSTPIAASGTAISITATLPTLPGGGTPPNGQVQFFDSLNGTVKSIGSPIPLELANADPVNPVLWGATQAAISGIFPDGTHVITAQYLGNASFNAVTSAPITVVVGARSITQTVLSVNSTSPTYGQMLTFAARITSSQSSGTPTGTVQLTGPGPSIIGSASLQNGVATFSVPWTAGGIQNVVARYLGDGNFASSQSNLVAVTLPSFEFTVGNNYLPIPAGINAVVTVRINPLVGFNSTVTLTCGSGIPAGSTCLMSPSSVTLDGVNTSTAFFVINTVGPSSNLRPVLTGSGIPSWGLSAGMLFVGVCLIGSPPTKKKRRLQCMLIVLLGLSIAMVSCGGGGGNNSSSNGGSGGGGTSTTTSVSSSAIKSSSGAEVTFTATVMSSQPNITGSVVFFEGTTQIGVSSLTNGQAQWKLSALSVGTHAITAVYQGDSKNNQSTSSALNQVITGGVQFPIIAAANGQTKTITMNVLIQ